ncbi:MAG: hypothetical protein JWL86_1977 [Rhizobium sp.]|nr:hypothetical protein [Rhizobium sp.]
MGLYVNAAIVAVTLLAASSAFSQTQRPAGQPAAGAKGKETVAQTCRRLSFATTPPGAAKESVRAAQIASCISNGGRM